MSYTCVLLDVENHHRLIYTISNLVADRVLDWHLAAHHMTLHMGDPNELTLPLLGKRCNMTATKYGFLKDRVCAVRISLATIDSIPIVAPLLHVTVYVNRNKGAKPKEANLILDWLPLPTEIQLSGVVRRED